MSSLINKIEQLIKREKTSPDTQKKDDTKKTSSEILSELFGVFNAAPPNLDNLSSKKSKKNKKKHKKEKKKRSRHNSDSEDSEYSYKHKKRKKKSKRNRHDSSPESQTPPKLDLKDGILKLEPIIKTKHCDVEPSEKPLVIKNEEPATIKREEDDSAPSYNTLDASSIPMPDSPKYSVDKADNDKVGKGKIQIKNLKFSTVFEETVKQAEEEARRKAEMFEEGEYSDSSSSTPKRETTNSEFPKTSDPGGILKKQAEEENKINEEKTKTKHREVKSRESRSSSRRRSRSHSSKRTYSRSHHDSKSRHRSRSRSARRSSYSSRKRSRSRRRSRSRSRSRRPRNSSRHRRSRSPTHVKLADSEKKRLLEVARRNAINMLKNGAVPAGAAALPPHTRNQVMAAIQSGGKSVDELTDFCKHLSKKEALGELSSVSDDGDMSENEDTLAFHHPFLVKEKAPIVMNIRGGAPLPLKGSTPVNKDELRLQFPVSSGSEHRSQWLPVEPPPKEKEPPPKQKTAKPSFLGICDKPKAPENVQSSTNMNTLSHLNPISYANDFTPATIAPPLPPPGPQAYPSHMKLPNQELISSVVLEKLASLRRETERTEAARVAYDGYGKPNLGQFMGSTGAQILTPKELASGTQAWAKKDQLTRAAPVHGGMGMHLLQKMGWTPGQGLGKEGTGTLQPLLLEVKLDTRGLQTKEEMKNRGRRNPIASATLNANGKHPVSLLGEYCSKHKLGPPEYNLCFECGPDHKKNFLFRVKVAGTEYQPAVASANKKQAKADAAQLALQKLGILK